MLFCKNAGSNARTTFQKPVAMLVDGQSLSVGNHVTTPVPVDWDHSGRLDILASGESGLLYLYRRSYLDGIHHKITCQVDAEERPVQAADDWAIRRRQIIAGLEDVMGPLPDRSHLPPLDVKIINRIEGDGYVRLSLTYQGDEGERVPAYLLLPKNCTAGKRLPAVVALHSTSSYGKMLVAGEAADAHRARANRPAADKSLFFPTSDTYTAYPRAAVVANEYGKELAQRGYVVLAPDYPSFGDYPYDFHKSKYASGSMKGIFNHMRGVDLLQTRDEVDPERIGAIGHSLGGHNALFLGVFDSRIKVVVSSCGWSPFRDSPSGGKADGWAQDVYMPRIRTVYQNCLNRVPFDFQELVAALAPRAFFSNSPIRDEYFDVQGVKRSEPEIRKVFASLGAADCLQIRYPSCSHDFPPEIRREAYAFIDKVFQHTSARNIP